jgi:hypothetical protein
MMVSGRIAALAVVSGSIAPPDGWGGSVRHRFYAVPCPRTTAQRDPRWLFGGLTEAAPQRDEYLAARRAKSTSPQRRGKPDDGLKDSPRAPSQAFARRTLMLYARAATRQATQGGSRLSLSVGSIARMAASTRIGPAPDFTPRDHSLCETTLELARRYGWATAISPDAAAGGRRGRGATTGGSCGELGGCAADRRLSGTKASEVNRPDAAGCEPRRRRGKPDDGLQEGRLYVARLATPALDSWPLTCCAPSRATRGRDIPAGFGAEGD